MPSATDPLARVKRAAAAKRRADQQYRAALSAAVAELEREGVREIFAQVARAAGTSRQNVRQFIQRRG